MKKSELRQIIREELLKEKKIEKNFSKVIGQKVQQVFYDEAGLVLITPKWQFDMNFIDDVKGSTAKLKGSIIKSVENVNGDIHISVTKKDEPYDLIVKSPQEVLIRK